MGISGQVVYQNIVKQLNRNMYEYRLEYCKNTIIERLETIKRNLMDVTTELDCWMIVDALIELWAVTPSRDAGLGYNSPEYNSIDAVTIAMFQAMNAALTEE